MVGYGKSRFLGDKTFKTARHFKRKRKIFPTDLTEYRSRVANGSVAAVSVRRLGLDPVHSADDNAVCLHPLDRSVHGRYSNSRTAFRKSRGYLLNGHVAVTVRLKKPAYFQLLGRGSRFSHICVYLLKEIYDITGIYRIKRIFREAKQAPVHPPLSLLLPQR